MISIVIPLYNNIEFLPSCFESLKSQTSDSFEVIVIDDGSTDGGGEYSERVCSGIPNWKVYRQENRGAFCARFEGIKRAQGDYIIFLDSDDCLAPNAINTLLVIVSEYEPDIVVFEYTRRSLCGDRVYAESNSSFQDKTFIPLETYKEVICSGKLNTVWGKAFKKNLFTELEISPLYRGLNYGEDLLLLIMLLPRIANVFYISDILYFYRKNNLSATEIYKRSHALCLDIAFSEGLQYVQELSRNCLDNFSLAVTNNYYGLLRLITEDKSLNIHEKVAEAQALRVFIDKNNGMISWNNRLMKFHISVCMFLLINGYLHTSIYCARFTILFSKVRDGILFFIGH